MLQILTTSQFKSTIFVKRNMTFVTMASSAPRCLVRRILATVPGFAENETDSFRSSEANLALING